MPRKVAGLILESWGGLSGVIHSFIRRFCGWVGYISLSPLFSIASRANLGLLRAFWLLVLGSPERVLCRSSKCRMQSDSLDSRVAG